MLSKFISFSREQDFLLPPSIDEMVPEKHLARLIVTIVDRLDFSEIELSYGYRGEKAYNPKMMTALLFYGYTIGIFSSRKLEKATYENLPIMYICGNLHPDHATIAAFRKRLLPFLKKIFAEILQIAAMLDIKNVGTVALDGTKILANASKHKAISYRYATNRELAIKEEIEMLLKKAEEADNEKVVTEIDIPTEIEDRHELLKRIDAAKCEIVRRHNEKNKKDDDETPQIPSLPEDKEQVNLTDSESRIMKTSKNGFQQCYNVQAAVDIDNRLILGAYVTQRATDMHEVIPMINHLNNTLEAVNNHLDNDKKLLSTSILLADAGYYCKDDITKCKELNVTPIIAEKRKKHNTWLQDQFKTTDAQKEADLIYSKRKSTVETVFGIIKSAIGFTRFHLRGKENVDAEFQLVAIGYNLKRIFGMHNKKTTPLMAN